MTLWLGNNRNDCQQCPPTSKRSRNCALKPAKPATVVITTRLPAWNAKPLS
ncbi:MAG: hypothetical protein HC889_06535 [Synechococcaceae cyanobacterium SM1_2_3]|nr:hypothetical protein [Synechococcaceae cyanobacterium SM1_2_3]